MHNTKFRTGFMERFRGNRLVCFTKTAWKDLENLLSHFRAIESHGILYTNKIHRKIYIYILFYYNIDFYVSMVFIRVL